MLIRRGRRVADYLQADCLALFVHKTPEFADLSLAEREAVEKQLRFARSLRIERQVLAGKDVPQTAVDFARRNQVTQIFAARSRRRLFELLLERNYGEAIVRSAHDLQVTVVADRTREKGF
jgi:two-component system sensor histidine kinase KdpD